MIVTVLYKMRTSSWSARASRCCEPPASWRAGWVGWKVPQEIATILAAIQVKMIEPVTVAGYSNVGAIKIVNMYLFDVPEMYLRLGWVKFLPKMLI